MLPRLPRSALAASLALALLACGHPAAAPEPLRVLLPSDILSLDPNRDVENVTDSVLFNVFEALVGFDDNLEVRPVLAESWEHPRPELWRFRLRPDVRFQDGTPLTASVVREALLDLRASPERQSADFLGWVKAITAVDDRTVDIETHEPRALLGSLTFLYIAKKNTAGAFPPLVGTGPYALQEWKPGERVTLARFDGYHGRKPEFASVVFSPVAEDAERVARLRRGEADLAYAISPQQAARPVPGVTFVRRPGLTVFFMGFDVRPRPDNPFTDRRVRQAASLALDRRTMVDRLLLGNGQVPTQPIASLVFGFNPNLPPLAYDLSRARALMAAAGWGHGFRTTLDVQGSRLPAAEFIRDALAGIGIEVQVRAQGKDAFFSMLRSSSSPLYLLGWNCSTGEASEFYEFAVHTPSASYGRGNFGGYSNPEIDRIAERNPAILDQRERKALLQKGAVLVMEDLPVVPLFVEDDIYGQAARVSFRPRADSEIRVADVRLAGNHR